MERGKVDLVRLPREEQVFLREDVFGRDTSSVFPTEAKKKVDAAKSAALEALGAKMFVSESELEQMKVTRGGGSVEDGTIAADKPLAVLLQENKEKKDAEFQEKLKIIKQGTHKPLDADEAGFLEDVMQQKAAKDREWHQQQQQELQAYREALAAAQQEPEPEPAAAPSAALPPSRPTAVQRKAEAKKVIAPAITVKPRVRPAPPTPANTPDVKRPKLSSSEGQAAACTLQAAVAATQAQQERQPIDRPGSIPSPKPTGLTGLLGGYGSDSDEAGD